SNIRGDVLAYQQQDAAAAEAYKQALQELASFSVSTMASAEELASIRGRSLGGMAMLSLFAGDAAQAEELYRQVIGILLPALGEAHPDSIWAMISWGSAAYANQDLETAREAWERVLRTAERVLGTGNTEVATIKSNLGRLELETGNYLVAESLLADALRIDREHRAEDFDDLSFTLYNLALALWALDQPAEATPLLQEAQRIASNSGHRMLGPILLAQAELACSAGPSESGIALAGEGLEQVQQHHGESDWRFDQALLVQAYCRASLQSPVPDEVAHDAACRLLQRWPNDGWFHQQVLRLGAAIQPVANFEGCGA
ncbi:MAG TPA: tetratricopeptide repeat protein, partial [Xanthomonadales bacterium]|nr:tetratricopeptide repeat protein [Xanthomonadales bacterium]